MINSLWISKTGMQAQQTQLDVISNNMANVSTNGFKRASAVFEDLMYQNLRQAGSPPTSEQSQLPTGLQVGLGVRTVATSAHSSPRAACSSRVTGLDVAIQGNGFFQITHARRHDQLHTRRQPSRSIRRASWSPATACRWPTASLCRPNAHQRDSISHRRQRDRHQVPGPASRRSSIGTIATGQLHQPCGSGAASGQNLFAETVGLGPARSPAHRAPTAWATLMQGLRRDLQRERGAGAGDHDPDPAGLRDEFQGHPDLGPDAAEAWDNCDASHLKYLICCLAPPRWRAAPCTPKPVDVVDFAAPTLAVRSPAQLSSRLKPAAVCSSPRTYRASLRGPACAPGRRHR